MNASNRLYRSTTDKVIGGVCGGLGNYLNIDPVIVRVLFVLLAIFGGSGVLVYIILWIVIPEEVYTFGNPESTNEPPAPEENPEVRKNKSSNTLIVGIVLIAVGLLIMVDKLIPMYNLWDFWPLILIAAGVLLIKPEIFRTSKNIES